MAVWVGYPYGWYGEGAFFADQVQEAERDVESRLLGPDGRPLRYERPPFGFDLRPRNQREGSK